jgi:hypothetical protein
MFPYWCRTSLGWTFRGSAYCQPIGNVNKDKAAAVRGQIRTQKFEDIIFSDEATV